MALLNLPEIPPAIPRRTSPLTRTMGQLILRLAGFRVCGTFPDLSKAIIIAAPHTSNWDFIFGIATVWALGIDVHWIGKHTLFRPPVGRLMTWLGGIPVDRRNASGTVGQVAGALRKADQILIGFAPEGTRKKVDQWKKGFYFIAQAAEVPTLPIGMDYGSRRILIGPPLYPSGDFVTDMKTYAEFYSPLTGKFPQNSFPAPE